MAGSVTAFWPVSERSAVNALTQRSANNEVELDPDEHVDRRGPKTSRLEPPLGNGRHGFFVEAPYVQRTDDIGFATCIRRL